MVDELMGVVLAEHPNRVDPRDNYELYSLQKFIEEVSFQYNPGDDYSKTRFPGKDFLVKLEELVQDENLKNEIKVAFLDFKDYLKKEKDSLEMHAVLDEIVGLIYDVYREHQPEIVETDDEVIEEPAEEPVIEEAVNERASQILERLPKVDEGKSLKEDIEKLDSKLENVENVFVSPGYFGGSKSCNGLKIYYRGQAPEENVVIEDIENLLPEDKWLGEWEKNNDFSEQDVDDFWLREIKFK